MDKKELRDALMHQLWRMNKMDLMVNMREYLEGESAALNYLYTCGDARVTPSQISENISVSRARMANILRSLRGKNTSKWKYPSMTVGKWTFASLPPAKSTARSVTIISRAISTCM